MSTATDIRAAALAYSRQQHYPLPVPFKSKNPGFNGWERCRIGPDDVSQHFNGRPQNVGLLLGISGLVDVDLDCPEARMIGPQFLPATPVRLRRAGRPVSHFVYRCANPGSTVQFKDVRDEIDPETGKKTRPMLVELRSTGGQTIVPPSIHPSGEAVEFDGDCTPDAINPAEIERPCLLAVVSKIAAGALLARHWPGEGSRHGFALALAGVLLRAGWSEEDTREFVQIIAQAAGDDEIDDRCDCVQSTAERLAMGGEATGWPSLIDAVGKPVADRVGKWLGIDRRGEKGIGLTDTPAPEQNGVYSIHTTPEPAEPGIVPQFRSVAELAQHNPALREPVIEGLLRRGETMNVISVPKIGKSWLVLDLAIALATGRMWLGKFPTVAGNVLIIDNELHPQTIANRIPKVASARGAGIVELGDRLCVDSLRGRLRDIYAMDTYFRAIEPGRFKLIILDAFYRFLPREADENSNADLAAIYNRIDAYADRLGCCFVCIHHSSKGVQAGKAVTDVGAGAGAQSRAVDAHLILRHHEEPEAVVLEAAVRSWPPVDPFCLRWHFPVWTLADNLNSDDLRKEGRKRKVEAEPMAPANVWTPQRFAAEFLSDKPVDKRIVTARACLAPDLSSRKAEDLIRIALADKLAYRWSMPKDKTIYLANREQNVTDTGVSDG